MCVAQRFAHSSLQRRRRRQRRRHCKNHVLFRGKNTENRMADCVAVIGAGNLSALNGVCMHQATHWLHAESSGRCARRTCRALFQTSRSFFLHWRACVCCVVRAPDRRALARSVAGYFVRVDCIGTNTHASASNSNSVVVNVRDFSADSQSI